MSLTLTPLIYTTTDSSVSKIVLDQGYLGNLLAMAGAKNTFRTEYLLKDASITMPGIRKDGFVKNRTKVITFEV